MPAIKCPACGYRHFEAAQKCTNCGVALISTPAFEKQLNAPDNFVSASITPVVSADEDGETDEEIAEYERFLAESGQSDATPGYRQQNSVRSERPTRQTSIRLPDNGEAPTRQTSIRLPDNGEAPTRQTSIRLSGNRGEPPRNNARRAPAGEEETSRDLVVRQSSQLEARSSWKKQNEIQMYEPYETALDIVPLDPFGEQTIARDRRENQVDPELWKQERLPWYFPRGKPQIAGAVIHIEAKEEIVDYPDLYAAIATLLVEFIWILVQVQQEKESDRIVMTTVRVQTYNNELKDARIRGNMRGANLSLGDQVSLWGKRRHGVLFLKNGYNHTTKGVVSTHSLGLIVPAIIVIVLALIGFYFAPALIPALWHMLISSLSSYFSFLRVHPAASPQPKK